MCIFGLKSQPSVGLWRCGSHYFGLRTIQAGASRWKTIIFWKEQRYPSVFRKRFTCTDLKAFVRQFNAIGAVNLLMFLITTICLLLFPYTYTLECFMCRHSLRSKVEIDVLVNPNNPKFRMSPKNWINIRSVCRPVYLKKLMGCAVVALQWSRFVRYVFSKYVDHNFLLFQVLIFFHSRKFELLSAETGLLGL